jgi:DNA-binding GntR family transcriptional regulator
MPGGIALKPVDANFLLGDHIYSVLREAILAMDIYDPATDLRLDERALAEQLGISRTPIREALVRLEQDGFIVVQARKGVFVLRKSIEEIAEMITVWAALESMAARLATERATDAEIASLREMGKRFSKTKASAHIEEYSEANIEFHQRILELSRCTMLKSIADGLFLHMRAVRRHAMPEKDRTERSVVDHMHIIEAIEGRDADLASRLVREHTMRLHDHVIETWTELEIKTSKESAAI